MNQTLSMSSAGRFLLVSLASLLSCAAVGGCREDAAPPAPAVAAPAKAEAPAPAPPVPVREIAGAKHVLVTYKGAELAPASVTRTREAALGRAGEALKKLTIDKLAFDAVATQFSDDEGSKNAGGALGNFERNAMPEAFSKVTFALKVGDVSGVVETPRGFHVIQRTR